MSGRAQRIPSSERVLFGVLFCLFVGLQLAFLANVVHWRQAPDIGWIPIAEFGAKRIGFVSALGKSAGLERGDPILSVNGKTYETQDELYELIDFSIGGATVYELARGDQRVTVSVTTGEIGLARVVYQSGLIWIAGTLYVAIGLIVFGMKPYHHRSWAFLGMAATAGAFITFMSPSYFYTPRLLDNVVLFLQPFLPATVLHLAAVFPQRRSFVDRHPRWVFAPYALSFALALVTRSLATRILNVPEWLLTIIQLYLFGSLLVFFLSTLHGFLRSTNTAVRVQSSAILAGIVVATLIPGLELVTNQVLKTSLFPNPILFYLFFLIFFPLSIGYAIVRHDLFEVDTIVKRTWGYVMSTAAVVGAYMIVVSTINVTFQTQVTQSPAFSILFVLAVVFVAEPGLRYLRDNVDRIFYRQRYDYRRTLREASETMAGILDPETVRGALLDTVVGAMFLENGALLLPATEPRGYRPELVRGGIEAPALPADHPLVRAFEKRADAVFRHDVDLNPAFAEDQPVLQQTFGALGAELVLPLRSKDALRGILSLGRKKSGKMFERGDLDLLQTLASQTAIAIENATLFDDLAASLKRIQILESVKSHLTKFVPRTVQQLIESAPDAPLLEKREADLSVLFADIAGYTKLSTELPLEEVNAIVERYFGAFLDEVHNAGGDVNETAGDGLMIIFQNDDPRRHASAAVRAGLGILRRARELNEESATAHRPILMHVGINSGIAALGATKIKGAMGDRWTYTASGPTTNIAARLAALSDGDALVLSDATRERLAESLPLEDLGFPALKNVNQPIRVWRLTTLPEDASEAAANAAASPIPSPL